MKKILKIASVLMLATAVLICAAACTQTKVIEDDKGTESEIPKEGAWKDAVYLKNTELGEGSKTLKVSVQADGLSVVFTVHTDAETVGDALIENGIVSGDEGPYGLYVKKVNGITADYDVDQTYWAFYINGSLAAVGIDGEEITEGAEYSLVCTK